MLPAWGALETNEQSPIYRYAKRAYFVIDKEGVVRYEKIHAQRARPPQPRRGPEGRQGRQGLVKRRPAAVFVALALLLPMAAAAAPDFTALGIQRYDAPKAAPAFTLPDLDGRKVQLADYKGKVVLLFYWATW